MSKKFMSEEDAKEVVKLLSKAYNFIVVKKFESVIGMTGDEEKHKRETWHLELAWSIDDKHLDTAYVKSKLEKKKISTYKIKLEGKDEYATYPILANALSGATLCSYACGDEDVKDVVTIPEFTSLNQLKMMLSINGLA